MTAKELKRKLIADGWVIKEGGSRQMATHPDKPGVKVPIPPACRRHSHRNPK